MHLILFPIPGHSYIPPDRVFGRIEKQVRKLDTIIDPACCVEIFKEHGTVFNLKNDGIVRNWKECVSQKESVSLRFLLNIVSFIELYLYCSSQMLMKF